MKTKRGPAPLVLLGLLLAGLLWWLGQSPGRPSTPPGVENPGMTVDEPLPGPAKTNLSEPPEEVETRRDHGLQVAATQAPEEHTGASLQARSILWQSPHAFARILRPTPERGEWTCDADGKFPAIPIQKDMTLAMAPGPPGAPFFEALAPSIKPNRTIHLGHVASLRFQAPDGLTPRQIQKAQVAVWCDSGEIWPRTPLSIEPHGEQWVLRLEELPKHWEQDVAQKILVRLADPGRGQIWLQEWTPRELQRGTLKSFDVIETGKLVVDVSKNPYPKNSEMGKQALQSLGLICRDPNIRGIEHPPALSWLACPDPDLWHKSKGKQWTLEQVPSGRWIILGTLSGTTQIQSVTHVPAGKTAKANLFGFTVPEGPTVGTALEGDVDLEDPAHNVLMLWDPLGRLSYRSLLLSDPDERHSPESLPWAMPHADATDFTWWLLHHNPDAGSQHLFGTFAFPSIEPNTKPLEGVVPMRTPRRLRIRLAKKPSTPWQGEVHLHFIAWQFEDGGFQVHHEVRKISWPKAAGSTIKSLPKRHRFLAWYATSPTGKGTFGTLGQPLESRVHRTTWIDPSMEEGWSMLARVQSKNPQGRQGCQRRPDHRAQGLDSAIPSRRRAASQGWPPIPRVPNGQPIGCQLAACPGASPAAGVGNPGRSSEVDHRRTQGSLPVHLSPQGVGAQPWVSAFSEETRSPS